MRRTDEGSRTTIRTDNHADSRAHRQTHRRPPSGVQRPSFTDVPDRRLTEVFRAARKDPSLAVLEGFHPLKHAIRFGADIEIVVTRDIALLKRLCGMLAPDVWDRVGDLARVLDETLFQRLAPVAPDTGVISIAARTIVGSARLIAATRTSPLVFLERPTHTGNIGAVVRVAAGAGAAGVITTGPHDPWSPAALRGGAGLQFALPVTRADTSDVVDSRNGPLLAVHPDGDTLAAASIPDDAILAFGSERRGLTADLLQRADARIAIPMEPGVSSLNLATSVAIVLYTWRLGR